MMTDIAKSGSLGLQVLAVCRDGVVALHHGVELVDEEDGARLLVGAENLLDCGPKVAGDRIGLVHGEIKDGVVDGAEDPTVDAALHGIPLWVEEEQSRRCASEARICRTTT